MVYVLLADGFEETELIVPIDILRRGGVAVQLAGIAGRSATSTRGITIQADILLDDLLPYDTEMLVLPGGQPGVDNLWANARVQDLVRTTANMGKPIGAICAAPMIPGRLGLLSGKKATCYPGCEGDLSGAQICLSQDVVADQGIITAKGAGCAFDFGLALLAEIKGEAVAGQVAETMQYSK